MNLEYIIERLSRNRRVFEALLSGITMEQAQWKPSSDKWSMLEVINHLRDEETEDFRQRLELVLTAPLQTWPRIDPQGWVTSRHYNESDLDSVLGDFLRERATSLLWLESLTAPNWQNRYSHPDGRIITAGDVLASWLAHDFLHVRQLTRLHWQYVTVMSEPHKTDYAGVWKESDNQ